MSATINISFITLRYHKEKTNIPYNTTPFPLGVKNPPVLHPDNAPLETFSFHV